jgi:hypothetical protein
MAFVMLLAVRAAGKMPAHIARRVRVQRGGGV